MPPARAEGPWRRGDQSVRVTGLNELQRAFKRLDADGAKKLRRELRDIANDVRDTARSYVPHKTGRHGTDGPRLAPSIRSNVTAYGASVSSDAVHSIVQDVGGRVGNHTILQRANVSHYMTEAVQDAQPYVTRRMSMLLDELGKEFEEG